MLDLPPLLRKDQPTLNGPMANESGTWVNNQPPAAFEKLWRGLALVGAIHLGGMLTNIIFQMMGNNSLDGIPAKFLGL